ncbi:MAG TPA: hypothetical protein PKM08_06140 [Syntrophorhabdaceae bacterium]|nr:hypothetical protein [Syntrophorhabdaceae bacterium]HNT68885.1 hypothetical protein [Syntrophorhabdaceae bacterium]
MEKLIAEYLARIQLGGVQICENLGVVPLLFPGNGGPEYMTLKEALERGAMIVTEVSEGGSVPELKVINKGDAAVLLLDGEELVGAKQNRVLNTTILVGAHMEAVIPVSCTEHGRWSYTSREFMDSDVVMYAKARREKARDVTMNLKTSAGYRSNQGAVWEGIEEMRMNAEVSAPTGAMKDVFEQKALDLNEYIEAIPLIPGQNGMMVFINGAIVGFDILSRSAAYASLHTKLLKSYAMEALLDRKRHFPVPAIEAAKGFLRAADPIEEKKYRSTGLGWDYRFEAPGKVGSALVHEDSVIHMAFFSITESEKIGNMSGFRQRRGYRR